MSLCVHKKEYIHIINHYTHIEIRLDKCKESCSQICDLVKEAIENSCKDLNCKDNYIFAFKCPKNKKCYCIFQEDDKSTRCTLPSQCDVLLGDDDSYRCWFIDKLSSPGAETSESPPAKRSHYSHTVQPTGLLDINDLIDVLDVLGGHGYSGVSYYKLGLHLGLLPATLNVIEANNKGDVESCLTKCLTAWLQQKDNVIKRGSPTYDTLIQALRKMGENAVADGIERDKQRNEIVSLEVTL